MHAFVSWLFTINSPDDEVRRRGRNLIILLLALFGLGLVFLPTLLFNPQAVASLAITLVSQLLYVVLLVMARRGLVSAAALILVAGLILATLGSALGTGRLTVAPFYLLLSVLVAGLTLRPWQIWLVLLFNLVGLTLTILALPNNPLTDPFDRQVVPSGFALLLAISLMTFLSARTTTSALDTSQQARTQAEQAAHALAETNAGLEAQIAARTTELQSRTDEQARLIAAQTQLLEEVEQQRLTIRELSVPVIPVSDTTVIMPLVGALDTERLYQLQAQALQALEQSSARYLILDITGVAVVDSQVAQGLLRVVQAARLLGTEVVLVGVRPEVAQAIVTLGLELRGLQTFSDLQSALGALDNHRSTVR